MIAAVKGLNNSVLISLKNIIYSVKKLYKKL